MHGFSLLEVIAVLAILALLAGVVTPLMTGEIEQARLERAAADTAGIAQAIGNFETTVGGWPTMDGSGRMDRIRVLITGSSIPTRSPYVGSHTFWRWARGSRGDLLGNHLIRNSPKGQTGQTYPTGGRSAWRGPYMDAAALDPWGRPYLVNVIATYSTHLTRHRRLWALSAGPDGRIQTSATASISDDVAGDDIGFLIQQR